MIRIVKSFLLPLDKFDYLVVLAFGLVSTFLIINHEPWRDEAQAWLMVRDLDIFSLIRMMGYEGTPALWHLILYPFAKLGLPYFSMAITNFLIMFCAVFIFVKSAPFSKIQKFLFIFGYYFLYEYNIIARNYALSILVLFLVAAVYQNRFHRPFLYSVLLFFLAMTTLPGVLISLGLFLLYLYEIFLEKRGKKLYFFPLLIVIFGFFLDFYQLFPPFDLSPHLSGWKFFLGPVSLIKEAIQMTAAFFPFPQVQIEFWNTSFVRDPWAYFLGAGLYFVSLVFFIRKPKVLFLYLFFSLLLGGLFVFKYSGYHRHYGLLFLVFIFCLWVGRNYSEVQLIKNDLLEKLLSAKNLSHLLIFLLLPQVLTSPVAAYFELNYSFSAGKSMGNFLNDHDLFDEKNFIATYRSSAASSILPYSSKPNSLFYHLETQDYRSFMTWNSGWYASRNLTPGEITERFEKAVISEKSLNLLILNQKLDNKRSSLGTYDLITSFEGTIQNDESFYLYQLKKEVPN